MKKKVEREREGERERERERERELMFLSYFRVTTKQRKFLI